SAEAPTVPAVMFPPDSDVRPDPSPVNVPDVAVSAPPHVTRNGADARSACAAPSQRQMSLEPLPAFSPPALVPVPTCRRAALAAPDCNRTFVDVIDELPSSADSPTDVSVRMSI